MDDLNINWSNTTDDDFFDSLKGSKSSKLQQLFVDDALSADVKEQSLKYERPKEVVTASNATSPTLVAKVVTAYKQGELQGKVGLSLTKNVDNICRLIMYKSKTYILTNLKLYQGSDLLYKQKDYWQFYDETSTCWSFSFDLLRDEKDFVEKLNIENIKFKEIYKTEPAAESHLNFSSFDNVAHSTESEDFRNNVPTTETKNSLITRIAKMGKPLPTLSSNQQTTTEFSDSSDTEVIKTPFTASQKPSIIPRSNKLATAKSNQQLVSSIVGLSSVAGTVFPINPLESQYMQMLLTEQRTQGSEIRMNMNKLENKIEKVLDKLEIYDRNDGKQKIDKDDEILELEEKLLILKKENRKLKQSLEQNLSQQSIQNQLQDILLEFEEDFKKFNIDCDHGFKNVLFELYSVIENMEKKMKENESTLEFTIKKNHELRNEISLLNQKENELKNLLKKKEDEALKQKQHILELENKLQAKDKVNVENTNDAFIKSVMNNLFIDIADKLRSGSFSNSEQILLLIATSIKQQTLASLQKSIQKDNLK